MPYDIDFFRDYGISPGQVRRPPDRVRRGFSWGQILGQYLATALMSGLGLLIAVLFAATAPFPMNVVGFLVPVGLFGILVFMATRNDYTWVELDGEILRAKHLYTRRLIERHVREIDDLLTLVFRVRTLATDLAEVWMGRIRGMQIRFRDGRTPLLISRVDPAMKGAKELLEAVVYRMSELAPVDAEIDREGPEPIIRRIHWKRLPPAPEVPPR